MSTATQSPATANTIDEARFAATSRTAGLPYMAHHVLSLIAIPKPGLGSFCVDVRGRMYYDPEMLDKWTLKQVAAVILHEDLHLHLRHHKRADVFLGKDRTEEQQIRANFAMDLCVNQILREAGRELPPGCLYPDEKPFNFPLNLSWEEYYNLLEENNSIKFVYVPCEGHGGKGKPVPAGGNRDPNKPNMPGGVGGGSCADGQQKPWEDGSEWESGVPEISERDQELMDRHVARATEEWASSNGRGSVPGDLLRHAASILRPKVDPWRELLAAVKYAVTATNGFGDFTYRKLPRRGVVGGVRLPAHFQPRPRVLILIDTSGSMGEKDLAMAMGIIAQSVKHLPRECVTVAAADTEIHRVQKTNQWEKVQLIGGGGTSMRVALEQAATLRPKTDVAIVVTDGETDWPAQQLNMRAVALLTRGSTCEVPSWMTAIRLETE